MANEQNLKPIKKGELTKEEAKKRGSNGGKKSAKVRKQKKLFKEIFIELLSYDIEKFTTNEELLEKLAEINPLFAHKIDVKTVISAQVLKKAINGDLAAISMLKAQIGEEPVQEINQTNQNINITDEKVINSVLEKMKDL
jgi:hemerythrin